MNPLALILIIILVLLAVGGAPGLLVTHNYGYWPSGGLGLILLIVLLVVLLR